MQGEHGSKVLVVGQFQTSAHAADMQRTPPRIIVGPDPEWRLQPLITLLEIREWVRVTTDPIDDSVFLQGLVMQQHKTREICQEMNGEPMERLGLAKVAQGNFQRIHVPAGFELVSRLRQALPQIVRAFGGQECLRPKGFDERILDERCNIVGNSITKSGERVIIEYCASFKRKWKCVLIASQVVEADLFTRSMGNCDGRAGAEVVVDDDVEGCALDTAGDFRKNKVLEPDTWVEEPGLMPREQ